MERGFRDGLADARPRMAQVLEHRANEIRRLRAGGGARFEVRLGPLDRADEGGGVLWAAKRTDARARRERDGAQLRVGTDGVRVTGMVRV
jgi:hypothetical protein